jgi:hypothetical protein
VFAILPFVLHHLGAPQRVTWATCSTLLGSVFLISFFLAGARARRLRGLPGLAISSGLQVLFQGGSLVFAAVLAMNALGIGVFQEFGPYFAGLAWLLVVSGVMFLRLLLADVGNRNHPTE